MTKTLVEQLRNPELSDTYKDLNWEIMGEAADEIERLQTDRDHWETMARTPAEGDPLAAALAENERLRAALETIREAVEHRDIYSDQGYVFRDIQEVAVKAIGNQSTADEPDAGGSFPGPCSCQVDQRTGNLIGGPCPACSAAKSVSALPPCLDYKHPLDAIKSVTTDAGIVYACERCSHHWFRKYGDDERAEKKSGEQPCGYFSCMLPAGHDGAHQFPNQPAARTAEHHNG